MNKTHLYVLALILAAVGLGLYRSVFGVILGEGVFLAAGIAVYIVTLVQIKRRQRAGLNEMAQGIE